MIISSKQKHGNAVGGDGVWVDAGFPQKKKRVFTCVGGAILISVFDSEILNLSHYNILNTDLSHAGSIPVSILSLYLLGGWDEVLGN